MFVLLQYYYILFAVFSGELISSSSCIVVIVLEIFFLEIFHIFKHYINLPDNFVQMHKKPNVWKSLPTSAFTIH